MRRSFRAAVIAAILAVAALPAAPAMADPLAPGESRTVGWGANSQGQLGNNTTQDSLVPVPVHDETKQRFAKVSTGMNHTLAIDETGQVWGWGANYAGQLGDGTFQQIRSRPVQAVGLTNVVDVAAGAGVSFALRTDGTVWAWGHNGNGDLGLGTKGQPFLTPVQNPHLRGVKDLEAGTYHSYAVIADGGTLRAWGRNWWGQYGNGTLDNDSLTPVQVPDIANVTDISTSYVRTAVARTDGSVWQWGYVGGGTPQTKPEQVLDPSAQVMAVAVGGQHSLALKSDGRVYAWGADDQGQLGLGDVTQGGDVPVPTIMPNFANVTDIAAGTHSSYALRSPGIAYSWGGNARGQLGDGTLNRRNQPGRFAEPEPTYYRQLSAGNGPSNESLHTVGIQFEPSPEGPPNRSR